MIYSQYWELNTLNQRKSINLPSTTLHIFMFDTGWRGCLIQGLGKKNKRNWVFATNSSFLIPISLQPDAVHLSYFKLSSVDPKDVIVGNILCVAKAQFLFV